jgi:hypothetical protein
MKTALFCAGVANYAKCHVQDLKFVPRSATMTGAVFPEAFAGKGCCDGNNVPGLRHFN